MDFQIINEYPIIGVFSSGMRVKSVIRLSPQAKKIPLEKNHQQEFFAIYNSQFIMIIRHNVALRLPFNYKLQIINYKLLIINY